MVDGYYISEGICAFIAKLMPEIITEGKLYKVYPPLYSVDEKDVKFVNSKSDLAEIFMKKVSKKYQVKLEGSNKVLTKDELFEFIYDTMEYYDELRELQKYFAIDKFFIERLSNFLIINDIHRSADPEKYFDSQAFVTTLMSYIQEEYPEVTLGQRNSISGIVEGKYASIKISSRNIRKISDFEEIFKVYGYKVSVIDKKNQIPERTMNIGRFMEEIYPLRAKIQQRFKGLTKTSSCKTSLIAGNSR